MRVPGPGDGGPGTPGDGGPPSGGRRLLLLGDDEPAAAVAAFATEWGASVRRLPAPDAAELAAALAGEAGGVDMVVIVFREDVRALRYALLAEHARPGVPLLVTLFDRTVAGEVVRSVPNCTVLGMTDALVPALLGPCLEERLLTLCRTPDGQRLGVVDGPDGPRVERSPTARPPAGHRLRHWLHAQVRPLEGTTRALLTGLCGLLGVFLLDTVLGMLVLHQPPAAAARHAALVLTTVDAGTGGGAHASPAWYLVLSTGTLLCVLGFTALFTAGLVDHLTSGRLTGLVGARAVPRHGHVLVVGLGQVGLRLCRELRALGIRVVAVERDREAPCVPLAKELGIPVVFGRGGDRFLLRKLALSRARAIAAVSSDALENITVAVAARAVAPEQRIVLRSGGEEDVISESRSLFRIATACDLAEVGGSHVAATALGLRPLATFTSGRGVQVLHADGRVHPAAHCARVCAPAGPPGPGSPGPHMAARPRPAAAASPAATAGATHRTEGETR
ncbi:NAD(P)-binding protein [Streptomyces sp. JJ36]|uniref:NAD(P)-binding protein n=1 Tax=Streptomyces sp. JJ36 TaxID=2736645 RepID=UPI001F349850|nr:NAD(P)-binding protein [Streptomyces sp. JJ36]MCF6521918.1 NAD-binding protein [Streptomyces sp. JJ36]